MLLLDFTRRIDTTLHNAGTLLDQCPKPATLQVSCSDRGEALLAEAFTILRGLDQDIGTFDRSEMPTNGRVIITFRKATNAQVLPALPPAYTRPVTERVANACRFVHTSHAPAMIQGAEVATVRNIVAAINAELEPRDRFSVVADGGIASIIPRAWDEATADVAPLTDRIRAALEKLRQGATRVEVKVASPTQLPYARILVSNLRADTRVRVGYDARLGAVLLVTPEVARSLPPRERFEPVYEECPLPPPPPPPLDLQGAIARIPPGLSLLLPYDRIDMLEAIRRTNTLRKAGLPLDFRFTSDGLRIWNPKEGEQ